MPYQVELDGDVINVRPKDRKCDVRITARATKTEQGPRDARRLIGHGTVTLSKEGEQPTDIPTNELGVATKIFGDIELKKDEYHLKFDADFRDSQNEIAPHQFIRIKISPAPRGRDDHEERGPRRRLFLERPGLFTSEGKTFILLECHLTRKIRDTATGKSKDIGIPKIPVFFKFNGIPHIDDPRKYERTDPSGRVLFRTPVELEDHEQRGFVQAVAKFGEDDFEYSEVLPLTIPKRTREKTENVLEVKAEPMGEEGNFYFLVTANLEGPNNKGMPVQLFITIWDREGNPTQINLGDNLTTDDSGQIMIPTRHFEWQQDWEQDIFFGGRTNIRGQEILSRIAHHKIPKRTAHRVDTSRAVKIDVYCDGAMAQVTGKDKDNKPCTSTVTIAPHRPSVVVKDAADAEVKGPTSVSDSGSTFYFLDVDDPKPQPADTNQPYDPTPDPVRVSFSIVGYSTTDIVFPRSK